MCVRHHFGWFLFFFGLTNTYKHIHSDTCSCSVSSLGSTTSDALSSYLCPLLSPLPQIVPQLLKSVVILSFHEPHILHRPSLLKSDTIILLNRWKTSRYISILGFSIASHQQHIHLRIKLCWMKLCRIKPRIRKGLKDHGGQLAVPGLRPSMSSSDMISARIAIPIEKSLPQKKSISKKFQMLGIHGFSFLFLLLTTRKQEIL